MSETQTLADTATRITLPLQLQMSFTESEFRALMRAAVALGASDITIQSGDTIWAEIRRKLTPLIDRKLEGTEVERVMRFIYGSGTGVTQIAGGEALDFEYEIPVEEGGFGRTMRFRVNSTGSRVGAISGGISITMRTIPGLPPTWDSLSVPPLITDNFFPQYGLVLVIGTTGSGKSTLLAAANRRRLESPERPVKILTYEDPIEFVYTGLAHGAMPQPSQVQIERNLRAFSEAGRNAMRRKADVIVMGESRDRESVVACFEMALTGHAVYSTLHADTPAEVFARMVSFFPEDSQPEAANKLLSVLKMIVAQKLERAEDGRVCAIRSWLVLDREVRRKLSSAPFRQWGAIVESLLDEQGTSFEAQTVPLIAQKKLGFENLRRVANLTAPEAARSLIKAGLAHAVPSQVLHDYREILSDVWSEELDALLSTRCDEELA